VASAVGAGILTSGEAVDGTGTVECITPMFDSIPENKDLYKDNYAVVPYVFDGTYVCYAFSFTGCENVSIPGSVTEIGTNPFADCDRLTKIKIAKNHPYLGMKDGVLFSKPDRRLITFPGWKPLSSGGWANDLHTGYKYHPEVAVPFP